MSSLSEIELDQIPGHAWDRLVDGAARGRSPFHTPVLATLGDGGPDARTVVLRAADAASRTVVCHTDQRSPKIGQLDTASKVAWVFYDREAKIQLRLWGTASLHHGDAIALARWQGSRPGSRLCYENPFGPGAQIIHPDEALPPGGGDGYPNFTVLCSVVDCMDWLYLRAEGHRRARFSWRDDEWLGSWVAP